MNFVLMHNTDGEEIYLNMNSVVSIREAKNGSYGIRCSNDYIIFITSETFSWLKKEVLGFE